MSVQWSESVRWNTWAPWLKELHLPPDDWLVFKCLIQCIRSRDCETVLAVWRCPWHLSCWRYDWYCTEHGHWLHLVQCQGRFQWQSRRSHNIWELKRIQVSLHCRQVLLCEETTLNYNLSPLATKTSNGNSSTHVLLQNADQYSVRAGKTVANSEISSKRHSLKSSNPLPSEGPELLLRKILFWRLLREKHAVVWYLSPNSKS